MKGLLAPKPMTAFDASEIIELHSPVRFEITNLNKPVDITFCACLFVQFSAPSLKIENMIDVLCFKFRDHLLWADLENTKTIIFNHI